MRQTAKATRLIVDFADFYEKFVPLIGMRHEIPSKDENFQPKIIVRFV